HPDVPVQEVTPIEYTVGVGQTYAVADDDVPSDYYRAATFDGSGPGDRTVVRGDDVYYQLWLAHRHVFVRAADVELHEAVVSDVTAPSIEGTARPGKVLTARPGTYVPSDVTVRYQWLRDGEPVRHAVGASYRVTGRDRGADLQVEVTVTGPAHAATTCVSPPDPSLSAGSSPFFVCQKGEDPALSGHQLGVTPGRWGGRGVVSGWKTYVRPSVDVCHTRSKFSRVYTTRTSSFDALFGSLITGSPSAVNPRSTTRWPFVSYPASGISSVVKLIDTTRDRKSV